LKNLVIEVIMQLHNAKYINIMDINSLLCTPVMFFGHSLGGLVAFEVARSLDQIRQFINQYISLHNSKSHDQPVVNGLILSAICDPLSIAVSNHQLQQHPPKCKLLPIQNTEDFLTKRLPFYLQPDKQFYQHVSDDFCLSNAIT
jgi:hypothetical protein